ncbi:sigma factor-like helix-turn-helix DNA-binding protein, partial [Aliarcobacter butzleri]|uniref:sigma factor-like helix-turn-helix DNA-binding protein n=1 Tax=Aliarcobacter butzleri TaxID=28197 RepID=UPI00344D9EC5
MINQKKLPESVKKIKANNINNIYGLSHKDIAKRLGLTRGQVWHLEDSAIKKIRNYIIEQNLSEGLLDFFEYKI